MFGHYTVPPTKPSKRCATADRRKPATIACKTPRRFTKPGRAVLYFRTGRPRPHIAHGLWPWSGAAMIDLVDLVAVSLLPLALRRRAADALRAGASATDILRACVG